MKILYSVHGYRPAYRVGGPIVSVSAVAERLVQRGHEVTVFTTNADLDRDLEVPVDRPVHVDGVQVWYFKREEYLKRWLPFVPYLSRSMGFLYAPRMKAVLHRLVPGMDLVHTHMPFVYPTLAAGRAAIRHHKPLFYQQRGVFDPARLKFRRFKKRLYIAAVERPLMRQASTLIALTRAEEDSYRSLKVSTRCRIIPNGVDSAEYRDVPATDVLQRWNVPTEAGVVLFLGRIHPTKGADRLIGAFAQVQATLPGVYLIMAGPDEWGLESRFRDQARQGGWNDRLIFTGMVEGEHKLDLLARADLFVLPSDAEGFSIAVLEALASATPVLISPRCHFPEVVAAGAGEVSATDVPTLARALFTLLSDRARLRAMGKSGRSLVTRHYTWDRVVDLLLDTYQEGLRRYATARRSPPL